MATRKKAAARSEAAPSGEARAVVLETAKALSGGPETILLVEDAGVVRSLLCEILKEDGYRVIEACDAAQAMAAGEQKDRIDLLLTDVMVPGMSGPALADRLRLRRKDLKVIYMSGYSGEALTAVKKEANFLEKPFKPNALAEMVRTVLDKKP